MPCSSELTPRAFRSRERNYCIASSLQQKAYSTLKTDAKWMRKKVRLPGEVPTAP